MRCKFRNVGRHRSLQDEPLYCAGGFHIVPRENRELVTNEKLVSKSRIPRKPKHILALYPVEDSIDKTLKRVQDPNRLGP